MKLDRNAMKHTFIFNFSYNVHLEDLVGKLVKHCLVSKLVITMEISNDWECVSDSNICSEEKSI